MLQRQEITHAFIPDINTCVCVWFSVCVCAEKELVFGAMRVRSPQAHPSSIRMTDLQELMLRESGGRVQLFSDAQRTRHVDQWGVIVQDLIREGGNTAQS